MSSIDANTHPAVPLDNHHPNEGDRPPEQRASRWLILAIVSAAQFLSVLDVWVVTIALPALQRDLGPATLPDVAWILNVYTIVLAALLVPAGRLADNIGRRRLFLTGLVVFGVASLASALAPTLPLLVVWRGVQAVGAALLLPTSLGLALPAFAPGERSTAVGVWAATGAVAAGAGPVLGGLLVDASWRWMFLINVPIGLVTLLVGAIVLPHDGVRAGQRADAVGTLLALGAIGLVCAGLIEASSWPAAVTWSALGAGLVLTAAFVAHTLRHPAPLLPPRLFAIGPFRASAMALLTYHVGFTAMLLGATLLLSERLHLSVLDTALAIAPGPIASGVLSPFSGRLAAWMGARRALLAGAGLFGLAGGWPLVMASATPSYLVAILPSMVLWGLANALLQPTLFGAADAVPRADLASGTAILAVARQLGSALGVALLVVVLPAGFHYAWAIVLVTAATTGAAGLVATRRATANSDDWLRPAGRAASTPTAAVPLRQDAHSHGTTASCGPTAPASGSA